VSAVLRSCDAVGVLRVALIYTLESPPTAFARTTSASAEKWVEIQSFESVDDCYSALKAEGFAIIATAVTETSSDLFNVDFARRIAIVFGNEMRGLSPEAIDGADSTVRIPMVGMVSSLNISVACAVTLYEAFRQRRATGFYDSPSVAEDARSKLVEDWLKR
jgi:tRNA (guanosine-2'-O-)-methyltransferase